VIVFRKIFGFAPWPVEWFIVSIPLVIFSMIWILIRKSKSIYSSYKFLFGKGSFVILGVIVAIVGFSQILFGR
jgi:hypothetical protein